MPAVLVEGALFFVPARVGVQEGGLYAIFLALGLDPVAGFSLGIVRRLRELTWGLAGPAILAFVRRRSKGSAEREENEGLSARALIGKDSRGLRPESG